jgi:hypothetical protein
MVKLATVGVRDSTSDGSGTHGSGDPTASYEVAC